jgi:hypothetical protein
MDRPPDEPSPESLPSLAQQRAVIQELDRKGVKAEYREAGTPFGDHICGLGAWVKFAVGTTAN